MLTAHRYGDAILASPSDVLTANRYVSAVIPGPSEVLSAHRHGNAFLASPSDVLATNRYGNAIIPSPLDALAANRLGNALVPSPSEVLTANRYSSALTARPLEGLAPYRNGDPAIGSLFEGRSISDSMIGQSTAATVIQTRTCRQFLLPVLMKSSGHILAKSESRFGRCTKVPGSPSPRVAPIVVARPHIRLGSS